MMETQVADTHVIMKNTAFMFVGQIITWALTTVFTVVVPRHVGSIEWGALTSATALTMLASTIFGLGISTVMIRDMARDLRKAPSMIGTAIIARVILCVPCLLLIAAVVQAGASSGHYSKLTEEVIYILTIGMLFQLLTSPFQAGFQAAERMYYNSLTDVISKGIVAFLSVGFVLLHQDIVSVVVVSAASSFVVLLLNLRWWRRIGAVNYHFDWKLMRYLVIGGLPFFATGIFLTIYLYIDSAMLSFMTPLQVVGWYGAPTKLFSTLLFLPVIFSTALFPALTRAFKTSPKDMVKLAQKSFNLLTALSLPVAVGGMLLSGVIIHLLYGSAFAPSTPIMIILSATLVPTYLNILINQFLVATDRQIAWTKVMAAACVLNPLLNFFLIEYFQKATGNGGTGAAIALLTTEVLMVVAGIALLPRGVLGINSAVTMVKSGIAAGFMALVVYYTRASFILIPILAGAVVYIVSALLLKALPREDLQMLMVFWSKASGKLGLHRVTKRFTSLLRPMWLELFRQDLLHWQRIGFGGQADGSEQMRALTAVKLWWNYPGVRATLIYRLGYAAHARHVRLLPGMMYRRNIRKYGLDIVPSVPIGPGLYIPHPVSTVIMARKIGKNVSMISSITIGMRKRHDFPTIGDDVTIGAGARVLGGVTIGDRALIGANAVVTIDVPADSTAVGIPARILRPLTALSGEALHGIPDAIVAATASRYGRETALRLSDSGEIAAIRFDTANGAYANGPSLTPEEDDLDGDGDLVTTAERERIAFTITRRPNRAGSRQEYSS